MAAPTRILSLNLGNQTIGLAEFKPGDTGGLVLSSYKTRELLADPAADATRLAQTKLVVDELVHEAGVKKLGVNYAVSAQSVFTRFVKLPSVGEEQVESIVAFEAAQNVPYPIDDVVWGYQLVDSGDPSQVEVVIVAIKSDLLDDINSSVEDASLKTNLVDVAPMALYNAYRYNYSDMDGSSLIVDIGARTTNLIFIEPHKVFSRSIPTGGSTLTTAIARDFNEPFAAAEERKKRDGFVSLGGAYAEPEDPDIARVSKVIRNSMTRLHAEIARSIQFYRTQQGGTPPQRVYLSGGSVTLPYMREFFHEKFQLPVEFFNPLRNVQVGSGLNLEEVGRSAHRMGELVGLALRGTSNCPMELNLQPASVVKRQALAERRPYIVLAGVCVLLTLAAGYLYNSHAAAVTQQVTQSISSKVANLQDFDTRIKKVQADIKAQEDLQTPLAQAIQERAYWPALIEDINKRIPLDLVWLTSFEVKAPEQPAGGGGNPQNRGNNRPAPVVLLKGLWLYNKRPEPASVVTDFVAKLKESPLYTPLDDPAQGYRLSQLNETEWAYEFEIPLVLKTFPGAQPPSTAPSPR
jgi:type IV pilus assembly protein PilM